MTVIGALLAAAFLLSACAVTETRSVRVGVYQNKPKIFMDENGQPAGILIELLDQIAAEAGWTLVYVPCEWSACLQALEEGQISLMPDVAYSLEREATYDFHRTPALQSWSRAYAAPAEPINNISDLDGKQIAVLAGSIQQTGLEQLMDGLGYQVTLIPADSFEQVFALVADGSADAAITNHFFGNYFYRQYGLLPTSIEFYPVDLYYATAEGRDAELLKTIDSYLSKWIVEANSPYYTALDHWSAEERPYRLPPFVLWLIGGSLGLLAISTGMITLLRRQVQLRTSYLEQANAELQESEQRYQTLASISPVGIFHTDENGATTYVNPKWCEIAGLAADQALGAGWLQAVHPDDQERLQQGWQESTRLQDVSYSEYRFRHADGTVVWVMGQAVLEVNARQQTLGYVGTVTDITERVRAETELRQLNVELEARVARRTEELKAAVYRAQESDRLKSAFLATMSHELRTPLNSIIGFTGVLLQGLAGPLNAEQSKQLGMVRDSSRHLLTLINDVLDISKIEAGQLELASAPFEMRAAIENALRLVLPQVQKKGLEISAEIATNVGVVVSDRRRVEQVLINLLTNAIKFTGQGGVRLVCRVEAGWLETSVSDTGIGIRAEDLVYLFKPFHQLQTGLNRQHEGTGLGLAICKNLVELLGGQIRAESEWGAGSTFTFTLPLTQQGSAQRSAHGEHPDH